MDAGPRHGVRRAALIRALTRLQESKSTESWASSVDILVLAEGGGGGLSLFWESKVCWNVLEWEQVCGHKAYAYDA